MSIKLIIIILIVIMYKMKMKIKNYNSNNRIICNKDNYNKIMSKNKNKW